MAITIRRLNEYIGAMKDFRVFLDDDLILNIHNGETITLDIPTGVHKIFIEVDEVISRKVKFEISDCENLNFVCGLNKPREGGLLIALLFPVRRAMNSYIELEKDNYLEII